MGRTRIFRFDAVNSGQNTDETGDSAAHREVSVDAKSTGFSKNEYQHVVNERRENRRTLEKLSVANRFRLMAGLPLLKNVQSDATR